MPGPDQDHPNSLVDAIKNVFDTAPDGADGIGATLGQSFGRPGGPATPAAIDGTAITPDDAGDQARLAGEISVTHPDEEQSA